MDFEFSEYFAVNPGLSFEEIKEVDIETYRRLYGSYGRVIEASPMETAFVQGPAEPPQSPVEGGLEVEKGGAKSSEQTTIAIANTPEA